MMPDSRPGPTSAKNALLPGMGGAALDLTTGDSLAAQLQDQLKKRQQMLAAAGAAATRSPFGQASLDLGLVGSI